MLQLTIRRIQTGLPDYTEVKYPRSEKQFIGECSRRAVKKGCRIYLRKVEKTERNSFPRSRLNISDGVL